MTQQLPVRIGYEYPARPRKHQVPCPHHQGVGHGAFCVLGTKCDFGKSTVLIFFTDVLCSKIYDTIRLLKQTNRWGEQHETRQHLIALMIMEKCSGARVVDIAKKTNLSRPAVSHHMQLLKDAGFVYAYKEGTMVYYSLDFNTDAVRKLKALIEHIDVLLKSEEHRNFLKKREEI